MKTAKVRHSTKQKKLKRPNNSPLAIGVFGGTFDPIHFGHLRTALELMSVLPLEQIRFIPCKSPVHKKSAIANANHRINLIKLAIRREPNFILDKREINRKSPSYMLETLQSLHNEFPNTKICLILGIDAFVKIKTWHLWKKLFDYAYFVVVSRPQYPLRLPQQLKTTVAKRLVKNPKNFLDKPVGSILFTYTTLFDISSTEIRHLIQQNKNPRYLLPEVVLEYIQKHNLYQTW